MNDSNIKSFVKRKLKVSIIMILVSSPYIIFIIGLIGGVYEIQYEYIGALIFLNLSFISFFILRLGIHNFIRINKFNKKYFETEFYKIDNELIHDNIELKNNKVYFTDNYFIETKKLIVIEYFEIAWTFIAEYYARRVEPVDRRLVIYLKDGTKYESRKTKKEIIQKLHNKIPGILIGYTFENITKANELYGITVNKSFFLSKIDSTPDLVNEKPHIC